MSAFLGISVWVTLATVVPGLVTIAVLYWSVVVVNAEWLSILRQPLLGDSDWVWAGLGITIMVITQTFGILLEGLLISKKWLGPENRKIEIAEGIDPHGETEIHLKPYFEYQGLYILLSELQEDEDTQGHLKRSLAQFFLTNNTLISFSAGILLTLIILAVFPSLEALLRASLYILVLLIFFLVSFKVARIRFEVMAKALWAARRRRLKHWEAK
jgi:hypothetical protein